MPIKEGYEVLHYATLFIFFAGSFLIALRQSKRTGKSLFHHLLGTNKTRTDATLFEFILIVILIIGCLLGMVISTDIKKIRQNYSGYEFLASPK